MSITSKRFVPIIIGYLSATLIMYGVPIVTLANPEGGTVVAGGATISQTPGNTQVNQSTSRAIINWQGFSIANGELTQFNQPSSSAIILNRVTGGNPSAIMGQMRANGQVWLLNPSGIVFGPTARVDVAGLLATTASITNENFMAGNYKFEQDPNLHTAVVNQGTIKVADQGIVALVAPGVENSGVIQARLGKVTLASGTAYTVDLAGDQLINFAVGAPPVSGKATTGDGRVLNDAVSNSGAIIADGGRVMLTANTARNVVDNAVSMGGVIRANTVGKNRNGEIVLMGGNGNVNVSGKMYAMGNGKYAKGGKIKVLGESVRVTSKAKINASGKKGGGEILIGGDYQGKNPTIQNAQYTYVDAGAVIKADALVNGDGGKVIVWADKHTQFNGEISAKGGSEGGNGGFVEVSGKDTLGFTGRVDLTAPKGEMGTLLLDPRNITISDTGSTTYGFPANEYYISTADSSVVLLSDLLAALALANVTIQTSSSGAQDGDITISTGLTPFTWSSGSSLTLNAIDDILVNSNVTNTGGANVNLHADYDGSGAGTVTFGGGSQVSTSGQVNIFYNPSSYATPTSYAGDVTGGAALTAYMLVNTPTNLQDISTNLAGTYALGRDIDMTAQAHTAIGTFTGIFDGQNNIIDNLTMNTATANTALFSVIGATGIVRNLKLLNVDITSSNVRTGALAGQIQGTVSNVTVSGTVTGGSNVGLLAGQILTGGSVSNSSSYGTVTATNATTSILGGLIGRMAGGTLDDSFSYASVNGTGTNIGGLVGQVDATATINRSYASGSVNVPGVAGADVGGFVGINAGTINNSYSSAPVTVGLAGGTAAGFVGTNSGTITNSYSTGAVNLGSGFAAANTGTVSNSFWDTQTSGQAASAAGTGQTTAQMQTQSTFTSAGWDFTTIWNNLEGFLTPYLRATSISVTGSTSVGAGQTVRMADYGSNIYTAITDMSGGYAAIVPLNHVVIAYLDNAGAVANAVFQLLTDGSASLSNTNNIQLTGNNTTPLTNQLLRYAKGSLADSDILYSVDSSNNLSVATDGVGISSGFFTPYQLDGNITTTNGNISFGSTGSPITFIGKDITITAGSGSIAFNNTLDGDYGITFSNSGQLTHNASVGSNTPLASYTSGSGDFLHVNANLIRTTGDQSYGRHTLSEVTNAVFESLASGDIIFTGSLSGPGGATVNTSGDTIFGSAPGGVSPLMSLTTNAGGTTIFGSASSITSGNQTFNDAVFMQGNLNFNGTNITFNNSINTQLGGSHALQISGNLILGSNSYIGNSPDVGSTGVDSLLVTGTSALNGGNASDSVTTNGNQTYTGAVTLGADATLTSSGSGNIAFNNTLNSFDDITPRALTVNTSGTTSFSGEVGTNALSTLTTDAGGSTTIGANITTADAQTYNDAVTLSGTRTLTSENNAAISFDSTVDGSGGLVVDTDGTITFGDSIGATTPLASLTTVGGTSVLNGTTIQTSGAQTFGGAITLALLSNIYTFSSTGNADIAFNGAIDGTSGLTVNTTGVTTFGGAVGATDQLTQIITNAGGTTNINGGSVRTSGIQTYNDAVVLGANATITSTVLGTLTFASTINSANTGFYDLTLGTVGANVLSGAIGGTRALNSLTTGAGGTTALNGGAVTTVGAQTYNDAVTLGANTTLTSTTSGDISFAVALEALTANTQTLAINTSGNTTFTSTVGATNALGSLTTDAGGTTNINGGSIRTSGGAQTYNDAVVLGANTTLTGLSSGDLIFNSTVNSAVGNNFNLTLVTTGNNIINGVVGGNDALGRLITVAGGSTIINSSAITTTIDQLYDDAVLLNNAGIITLTSPTITFNSTVDSQVDPAPITGLAIMGNALFGNGPGAFVGATKALASLSVSGTSRFTAGNASPTVTTTGNQTYSGAVTLGADSIFTSTASGDINFVSTLDSFNATARTLAVNTDGTTTFGGVVGGTNALASLTTDADGSTNINTTAISTTGAQTYNDAVVLGANASLTSLSLGDLIFNSTVDSAAGNTYNLTLGTGGDNIFNGVVGGNDALGRLIAVAGGSTIINSSAITTTIDQLYDGAVLLNNAGIITLTSPTITFNSTVDSQVDPAPITGLAIMGNALFGNGPGTFVGATKALASLSVSGTSRFTAGNASPTVTTTGNQTYSGAVTLGADSIFTSTASGNINFGSTLNSFNTTARALVVNTGGTTTFGGAVGGTNALSTLTTDTGGATAIGANITTDDEQTYNDAVILSGTPTLLSNNDAVITFAQTVDGAGALTVTTGGNTIFGDEVGGSTPITSLTTNGGGTTFINGGSVASTGAQTYSDVVSLGTDTTLTSTGSGNISFAAALDALDAGVQTLAVNTSGNTIFNSTVGSNSALGSLTTDAGTAGGTQINGSTINTVGAQIYNDAVTLGATTGLSANGIFFNNTLNSSGIARILSLNNIGTNRFGGAVGNNLALASITTTGGSTTEINGSIVNTTGDQFYSNVTLGDDATITSTGAGEIRFGGTLNSSGAERDLIVNTSGISRFVGIVGGTLALSSLTTDTGGSTNVSSAINTTGNQTYNDAVSLNSNVTFASTANGDIAFGDTIDSNVVARSLIVNTGGTTIFDGAVGDGGGAGLISVTTDAGGTTQINGGSVLTTGAQSYGDAVTLGANTTLTSSSNGAISFANTLNSFDATPRTLAVNTGGTTSFNSSVGANNALSTLETDAAGGTTIGGDITTEDEQTFNDAVTVSGTPTLLSNNDAAITFALTVDGAGELTVDTNGAINFGGNIGATTPLTSLTTVGGTSVLNGTTIQTSGAQTFGGAITLALLSNIYTFSSTGNADITFNGAIDGTSGLTVNTTGATTFGGAVGATDQLTQIITNAGGTTNINGGSVRTSGIQTYNDAVVLGANAIITSTVLGTLTFASTINSANTGFYDLTLGTVGANVLSGAIGGSRALNSLITGAGGTTALNGGVVNTVGAQSYGDAVTLGANTTLTSTTSGDISFAVALEALTANIQTLEINTSGNTTFTSTVGATNALGSLTTNAGGTGETRINGGLVRTAGAQSYGDAVTLNADTTLTSLSSGNISFANTLNSFNSTPRTLAINTGGNATFSGAVGGTNALSTLTTDAGGSTTIGANITTANAQTYNDAVSLSADTTLTSVANTVIFGSNVAGNNNDLTLDTATGLNFTTTINLGSGTLTLSPNSGGVTQSAGSIIAGTLLLDSIGNVTLGQTTNDVNVIAGELHSNLVYYDADDLIIGDATNDLVADGTILINAVGNLTLANDVTAQVVGDTNSLVLVTGSSFINNAGVDPLHPGVGGRYLVYSVNPENDTLSGLLYDTKRYDTNYIDNPPSSLTNQISDMLLYSIAPTLTFTADNQSKDYGTVNPTLTYTVTGFINGDTSSDSFIGTPSLSTTATTSSLPGGYTINIDTLAIMSEFNYAIASVDGTLTITGEVPPTPVIPIISEVSITPSVNPSFINLRSLPNYECPADGSQNGGNCLRLHGPAFDNFIQISSLIK